eukprot:m.9794 g.9794  ORF g.9794 m.9794 type:complete len:54 (+) comp21655_c0_seq1:448-609(+)
MSVYRLCSLLFYALSVYESELDVICRSSSFFQDWAPFVLFYAFSVYQSELDVI